MIEHSAKVSMVSDTGVEVKVPATVYLCENPNGHVCMVPNCSAPAVCRNDAWHIFKVEGQDHEHLQCTECGTSYCAKGGCDMPEGKEN